MESNNNNERKHEGQKQRDLNMSSPTDSAKKSASNDSDQGRDSTETDKYLAMEQTGVTYTDESNAPLLNSDQIEDRHTAEGSEMWDRERNNSRNSDAFNQDDYMLNDNIDLDEDQSQSISSDDK